MRIYTIRRISKVKHAFQSINGGSGELSELSLRQSSPDVEAVFRNAPEILKVTVEMKDAKFEITWREA